MKVLRIIIVLAVILTGVVFYIRSTPEYALAQIVMQVKEEGFEAVERNLTEEAQKKVEPILAIIKSDFVNSLVSLFTDQDTAGILVEKASEIEWSVGDIIKNSKKATVTVGFDYNEKMKGTIDLDLIKEDGKWKINDLSNLKLDN